MDSETRGLRTTALILLVVSAARWTWDRRPSGELGADPASATALLDSSRARAADEAGRSRPLGPGERIDPNRASVVELDRLPGVGPSLAAAIVSDRAEVGPFESADDLARVSGLGPRSVERIRPLLDFSSAPRRRPSRDPRGLGIGPPSRIDLNRADVPSLTTLPGVGPAIAERIVAERRKHPFRTVDELVRVRGIGPTTLERLRPRVTVTGRR